LGGSVPLRAERKGLAVLDPGGSKRARARDSLGEVLDTPAARLQGSRAGGAALLSRLRRSEDASEHQDSAASGSRPRPFDCVLRFPRLHRRARARTGRPAGRTDRERDDGGEAAVRAGPGPLVRATVTERSELLARGATRRIAPAPRPAALSRRVHGPG